MDDKSVAAGMSSSDIQYMIRCMSKYPANESIAGALVFYEAELAKRITSHGRVMRCG